MSEQYSADVVVVGAGICGGTVAKELAEAGLSVLVLEAGPRWERGEVVENWRNMPPVNKSESDHATPYPAQPWAVHPQMNPYNEYPEVSGSDASAFRQGMIKGIGGTTWHWAASCWRFLPADLQLHSTYGVGRDWEVTYDELEDYYYRAEVLIGVNGPNDTSLKYVAPVKSLSRWSQCHTVLLIAALPKWLRKLVISILRCLRDVTAALTMAARSAAVTTTACPSAQSVPCTMVSIAW